MCRDTILSEASGNILLHHLKSFQENDIEALMSDYTAKSVLITQDATYIGLEEIRTFFTNLIVYFPKQKSIIELDKMEAINNLLYIVWHAKTPTLVMPFGTDTFIIEHGKICQQTFAGQLTFNKKN